MMMMMMMMMVMMMMMTIWNYLRILFALLYRPLLHFENSSNIKFLTKLINQGYTCVTMAWITNTNYCSNDPQERLDSAHKVSWDELSN